MGWVVKATPRPLYPPPPGKTLGGPQGRYLSICHLEDSSFIQKVFTTVFLIIVYFVKIGSVIFFRYFPHLLSKLFEFRYKKSKHNAVEYVLGFVTFGSGKVVLLLWA